MLDEGTAVMEEAAVKCDGGSRSEGNERLASFFLCFSIFLVTKRDGKCVYEYICFNKFSHS